MSARGRPVDCGLARGRRIVVDLSREIDEGRLEVGLSDARIGRAVGLSGEQAARICRGESRNLTIIRAAAMLAVVGRDLSARSYAGGQPIRDAAHTALLGRLRARIGLNLR